MLAPISPRNCEVTSALHGVRVGGSWTLTYKDMTLVYPPVSTFAGMIDITTDPDYAHVYDCLPIEQPGDIDMAEDRRFFMSHVNDLSMNMTLFQHSIQQHKHLFITDSDWSISSVIRLTGDKLDRVGYERLNARLQLHEIMLQQNICNKTEVRKQLYLLKLISFLVPFLVAMKKKMRVPDLNKMLPNMTGT